MALVMATSCPISGSLASVCPLFWPQDTRGSSGLKGTGGPGQLSGAADYGPALAAAGECQQSSAEARSNGHTSLRVAVAVNRQFPIVLPHAHSPINHAHLGLHANMQ